MVGGNDTISGPKQTPVTGVKFGASSEAIIGHIELWVTRIAMIHFFSGSKFLLIFENSEPDTFGREKSVCFPESSNKELSYGTSPSF